MNITVITVGKIKESYFKDAVAEYSKRLRSFCNFSIIEVPDERAPEQLSQKEKESLLAKEGQKILDKLPKSAYIIGLFIDGKMLSSEELSIKIKTLNLNGISDIVFIIGASLGLSNEVKSHCNFLLSFSKVTFPHQLMRVILTEQIYRALTISANLPYHK